MLFIVTLVSVIAGNDLIAISAGGLLLLNFFAPPGVFDTLDRLGVPIGVVFLTVGLLLPFSTGKLGLAALSQTLMSPTGVVSIIIGIASSYLAADGIKLLVVHPEVMVGLVIGSILGVSFFGGIPVGPLVAAGLSAFIFRLLRF